MVFQNPDNQLVAAIVEEETSPLARRIWGYPRTRFRKRVDYALEKVGTAAPHRTHSPAMLSVRTEREDRHRRRTRDASGLRRRLDEPTAMLDPLGRKEVMDTIHELNRSEGQSPSC